MVWVGSVQLFVVYAVSVSRSVCKPNFPFVNFSREIVGGCTFDYVFDSIRGVRPKGNGKGIREPSIQPSIRYRLSAHVPHRPSADLRW